MRNAAIETDEGIQWAHRLSHNHSLVRSIDTKGGPGPETFAARLRSLLVCPACRGGLDWGDHDVRCTGCGATYELADGIPLLRIGGSAGDEHQEQQAAFFDDADPEFEITRPHGTPWLYSWLLGEKFRRSVDALTDVPTTAVTICGGSGMDAEFIAQTLCLEHGWPEPNTLHALERGRTAGLLPDAGKLIKKYRELRSVEGILRRWSYEGETVLPDDPAPFYRVSVRCGFATPEAFRKAITSARQVIRTAFLKVFSTE